MADRYRPPRSVDAASPSSRRSTGGDGGSATPRLSRLAAALDGSPPVQRLATASAEANRLPAALQAGVERLAGVSLAGTRVYRDSPVPARIGAHAFARGRDIHLAPGQDHHLPHEAWHLAQQAQGRVAPTLRLADGTAINDDAHLEREADEMGARAASFALPAPDLAAAPPPAAAGAASIGAVSQRALVRDQDIIDERAGAYSWTSFRGKASGNGNQAGEERGRGAFITAGPEWETVVRWNPVDPTTGEGTGMVAEIGPDHNLGSKPSAANALARVAALKALAGKTYIAGHLLNERLGGPGNDPRNLTAITGSANTLQSSNIEEKVRDPVNEDGAWMHYAIDVRYAVQTRPCTTADDRKRANTADGEGAKGIIVARNSAKIPISVTAHYADRLTARWYAFDSQPGNPGQTTPTRNVTLDIPGPLAGGNAAISAPTPTGAASGHAAAVTRIDAEELVLTASNLLKHIVDNREPLVDRVRQLREAVADLEIEAGDAYFAYQYLGEEWGRDFAYRETLATHHLGPQPRPLPPLGIDAFDDAVESARPAGVEAGEAYRKGFDDGWSDLDPANGFMEDHEVEAYDEGHAAGIAAGDYRPQKNYSFAGIALLSDIVDRRHNTFLHAWGNTTVALTGGWFQEGMAKWYEVRLVLWNDPVLDDYWDRTFWMKRRWLNKGRD